MAQEDPGHITVTTGGFHATTLITFTPNASHQITTCLSECRVKG